MNFDLQAIEHNAREILNGYGQPNKHDRCNVLIHCCIEAGMRTGNEIVGSVRIMAPDLDHRHIGMLLNTPLRSPSGDPYWRKDPVAGYVLN